MKNAEHFLFDHQELTWRYFIRIGAAGAAALGFWPLAVAANAPETLEPYFTPASKPCAAEPSTTKALPSRCRDRTKKAGRAAIDSVDITVK